MIIRHFVLPTKGLHTFVFAVLGCFTIRQEILIVGALSVHSDGVAPVHNSQHVLPVSNSIWHQDFFHKASMAASQTVHTENREECSSFSYKYKYNPTCCRKTLLSSSCHWLVSSLYHSAPGGLDVAIQSEEGSGVCSFAPACETRKEEGETESRTTC